MLNNAKSDLFRQMNVLGFTIHDLALYLDTHPTDLNALNMYQDMRERLKVVRDQYTSTHGSMNHHEVMNKSYWTWVSEPWPWETGSEV